MKENILSFEETIEKVIKLLSDLKTKDDIETVKININKYWMNDYYDTDFKVDYNIGKE